MQTCVVRPILSKKVNDLDLNEFTKLSEALPGIKIVLDFFINLKKIYPGTFLGSGKITYLKKSIFDKKVKLLLIDFVLSAVQQRNLEQELNIKILDRTGLILEIFS